MANISATPDQNVDENPLKFTQNVSTLHMYIYIPVEPVDLTSLLKQKYQPSYVHQTTIISC